VTVSINPGDMSFNRFNSDEFQNGVTSVLESAERGGSDIGEVLATASRIDDGDAD
jgi:hypothetical protein